jgi:DNA-binding MarR family transcriptional regulator
LGNSALLEAPTEYVNMADLNSPAAFRPAVDSPDAPQPASEPVWDMIELLFFAYRDFVGDADHVLETLGFGRAHHRVLHFVNRNPGIKVADLLDILRITKQSLGRVLKALVEQDYIEQRAGPRDRRQRLLFVTRKGHALAMKLASLQSARISRALDELEPRKRALARDFLIAMIDSEGRDQIVSLATNSRGPTAPRS